MILASLECPSRAERKNVYIQIKWRPGWRDKLYRKGDILDNLYPEYNDGWVRTDYVCEECSPKTKGKLKDFIRTQDQRRHYCFVNVKDSRLVEILSEKEFRERKIENFVVYE